MHRRKAITIWEVPTGRAVLSLRRNVDIGEPIIFHPQSHWIATAANDGTILLWPTTSYYDDRDLNP